jgi:hypothetical protein
VKLLFENWRKFVNEAHGTDTTWDDVHINDVFEIIGKSCEEGRECKSMPASELRERLKNKPSVGLDPARVAKASLQFPLIVVVDNGEYQYIMDGNHRFARAEAEDAIVQVKELYTEEYNKLFGVQNETPV